MEYKEYTVGRNALDRLTAENRIQDFNKRQAIEAQQAAEHEALQREPTEIVKALIAAWLSQPEVIKAAKRQRHITEAKFSGTFVLRPFVAKEGENETNAWLRIEAQYNKRILKRHGAEAAAAEAVADHCDVFLIFESPGYDPTDQIFFSQVTSSFGQGHGHQRDLESAGIMGQQNDGQPEFFKAMMREAAELAGLEVLPIPDGTAEIAQPVAASAV